MSATLPEPESPVLTKYRVVGQSKVCGIEPGKTFDRAFPPKQEAQLLAGGAIEKVGGKPDFAKGGVGGDDGPESARLRAGTEIKKNPRHRRAGLPRRRSNPWQSSS